jgi:chromosome segregation ATPase
MAILVRLLLVLTIAAGGVAIWKGLELKEIRKKLDLDLAAKTSEANKLTTDLASEKSAHKQTGDKLKETDLKLNDANNTITSLKSDIETHKSKISEVEGKLANVSKELAEKQANIDNILRSLPEGIPPDQIAVKIKELQDERTAMAEEKKVLNEQLKKLELKGKELEQALLMRQRGQMPAGLTGHVLAVNDEYNFVVLDIGINDRVVENAEMIVYRDGNLVGKIRITSVEPSISIADVLTDPSWKKGSIEEGDLVVEAAKPTT